MLDRFELRRSPGRVSLGYRGTNHNYTLDVSFRSLRTYGDLRSHTLIVSSTKSNRKT